MRSRAISLLTTIALILPAGAAVAASGETVRSFTREFDGAGLAAVAVDFPIGELELQGTDDGSLRAEVAIECGRHHSRAWCEERADGIDLESRTRDGRLELTLTGFSKWRHRNMHVEMTVYVPARLAVDVEMSIGELDLRGLRGDVSVDMSIGEVTLTMRESDVGDVRLDTGIGEAALRTGARRFSSAGLFTRELRWDDGGGQARVRIDLGIGEVSVRLS